MATQKQVNYIMVLLSKAGYSTRFMNAEFKKLGASMKERSGSVESWVKNMDAGTASALIEQLKGAA